MDWLWLALASAWLLGFYEIAKKTSLRDNSVFGVLCASSWCGLALVLVLSLALRVSPESARRYGLELAPLAPLDHLRVLGKAVLVSASWVATFFALKHLPLSLAGPL
ncbi:MAG TPA: hypothetical protein VLC09_00560, partial [Polyangiaceae bacterium]|nr:hypothetical protein [Polyangiaceae bacterium]